MQRILVIDDDEDTRELITIHLSPAYEVIEMGGPERAFTIAAEQKPDAILLDLTMPGISGFELCQSLCALNIPIFIISGQDERNKAFCRSLGASGYFSKPIDFKKLKADLVRNRVIIN